MSAQAIELQGSVCISEAFLLVGEVDKSKASVLASVSVIGNIDAGDGSTGREELLQRNMLDAAPLSSAQFDVEYDP